MSGSLRLCACQRGNMECRVKPVLLLRGTTGSGKTSTAQWMQAVHPTIDVIEVDDIKLQRHQSVELCQPDEDFPEAGRRARRSIDEGRATIVVETFCEKEHLVAVLKAAGLSLDSPNVN